MWTLIVWWYPKVGTYASRKALAYLASDISSWRGKVTTLSFGPLKITYLGGYSKRKVSVARLNRFRRWIMSKRGFNRGT